MSIQQKILCCVFILISLLGCEHDTTIERPGGKLQFIYIFSDSDAEEPYSFNEFFYDKDGNLIKKRISDYPEPVFASFYYDYSDDGKLISEKYKAIQGASSPDQSEDDLSLVWEKKYSYTANKKIEKEYYENSITDSVIYVYDSGLLVEETHYDIEDSKQWSREYTYNSYGDLMKKSLYPDSIYTEYIYENNRLHKTLHYDKNDSQKAENLYMYSTSGNKEITEVYYKGPYGEFITEKIIRQSGKKIEHIKYHPTFQGAEWWCKRYEYSE